jgi:hypothetical protein
VAVDAAGNVIVVGNCTSPANFGGADLTDANMFVAKYSATGAHIWSKPFGTAVNYVIPTAVGVDASGLIYIAGYFDGTVNLGGGAMTGNGVDIFVLRLSAGGGVLSVGQYGGAGTDQANAIVVDSSGNYALTGAFDTSVNFGGGALTSQGLRDPFVAKFNAFGTHQWSARHGGTGDDTGQGVAMDGSGNVVYTGYFSGTGNFGGSNLSSAGGVDIFLARYNSSGVHQWSQAFGGTGTDTGVSVTTDGGGNVVLTGSFAGSVSFGGPVLVATNTDIFLSRYTSAGDYKWSQSFGATGNDRPAAVSANAAGDIALTGYFFSSANFGGGTLVSAGSNDIFLAKFSSGGTHAFSRATGGTSSDAGNSVAFDAGGNVVAGGFFQISANFGAGTVYSSGGVELWLAKYGDSNPLPAITSISDIGNDQGRKVKIIFSAAGADNANAGAPVVKYEVYRRDDPPPAMSITLSSPQLLETGWTQVGAVDAHGNASYGVDAPTIGDSTLELGPYVSYFFIRATTGLPAVYFDSPMAGGSSVDNLAPAVPNQLVYDQGLLTWNNSSDEDFKYFTVYGSDSDDFAGARGLGYTVSPKMEVDNSYIFYYVTATDFSGNESTPAKLNMLSTVGTPSSYVLSLTNHPNPFNPRTTVSYTVPDRARVRVRVFDATGAYVTTLFEGERAAGTYSMEWDGRAANGATVGSGVYFACIEHQGDTRTRKMMLLK